jgi:uncharacterized protein YndB with AHSA1/START domain
MHPELIIRNTVHIKAPASKVWDALTNPSQTKKYMFGCETVSDWKEGSTLLWKGQYESNEMVFVKGNVVSIAPDKLLAYTVLDPNNQTIADIPENYLTVTYTLNSEDEHTVLTVTQGDYSKVAEGQRRYQEAYNHGEGWNPILMSIKELVETA